MENATKALLIAAAVLIAILIISLTIIIYRNGQEAVTGADFTEAQATQFNSKFTAYEGSNKSTAQVNALLSTALAHNLQEKKEGTGRYVTVTVTLSDNSKITINKDSTSRETVPGSDYYDISCTYTGTLVTSITVD